MSDDATDPRSLDADLRRLLSDERSTAEVKARARERALRQQATEDATLVGLLVDLSEQGHAVTVRMTTGRSLQGRVATVGPDFIELHTPGGAALVALGALASIRRRPGRWRPDSAGDRAARSRLSLSGHLRTLAADRPRVGVVVLGEPHVLNGELWAVGRDVLTLALDGEPVVTAYLSLSSLAELSLLASG
jgi:hypothetical protein